MILKESTNMNMKYLCIFLLYALVINGFSVKAQNNFTYTVECIENNMPINDFDTLYAHQCIIDLNDTLSIDSIRVQIGDAAQSSNILHETIGYDQSTFLPKGLAYYRRKSKVILELGNYRKGAFYYGISLIDTSGVESPIIPWNNQNQ